MSPYLERATLLYQQSRYELAEEQLHLALGEDPHNPHAHALLALCLKNRHRFKEATTEAQQAIHLAPDYDFAYYALAMVWYERNDHAEALTAIQEAIRLNSTDATYFSFLAALHFESCRWQAALQTAEKGLEFDAEHVGCNNLRAMALVKLGRREEAGATIDSALARNPDNSLTHANQGWAYLEENTPDKALHHFQEALRLDPENDWAREGIVTALKAKHFIYALFLRYFLWMTKLPRQVRIGVIVGGWFGNQLLGTLAGKYPDLSPFIWPIRLVYVVFALMTWLANPLFNLVLRCNRFGRLALSREQIVASNWIGGCLLLGALLMGSAFWFESPNQFFIGLGVALLVLPFAGAFNCPEGWPRKMMFGYIVLLVLLLLAGGVLELRPKGDSLRELGLNLGVVFVWGVFLSGWVANGLSMVRPRR